MITIHKDSHTDHAISEQQLAWLLTQIPNTEEVRIVTLELPEELGTVRCCLHGPIMGDQPIASDNVSWERRGNRDWLSRMIRRPARYVRTITAIVGPHDGLPNVLYTAFGGPPTPQEPYDPGCKNKEASTKFWSIHALSE